MSSNMKIIKDSQFKILTHLLKKYFQNILRNQIIKVLKGTIIITR